MLELKINNDSIILLRNLASIYPFDALPLLKFIQDKAVIAGGSLLYAEGKTKKISDIDVFILNKDNYTFRHLITFIRKYIMNRGYDCKISYLYLSQQKGISIVNMTVENSTIQLILSNYSNVMEVLDGFDLGCIQAALYQNKYYQVTNRESIHVVSPSYYRLYKAWSKDQFVPLLNYNIKHPQPQYQTIGYKALLKSKLDNNHLVTYLSPREKRKIPLDIISLKFVHFTFKASNKHNVYQRGEFEFKDKNGETIVSRTFPMQLDFDNKIGEYNFYLYSWISNKKQQLTLQENWLCRNVNRIRDGCPDQSLPLSGKGIAHIELLKIGERINAYIIGFQANDDIRIPDIPLSLTPILDIPCYKTEFQIDIYWKNILANKIETYENLTNGRDIYQLKRQALYCFYHCIEKKISEKETIDKVISSIDMDSYKYGLSLPRHYGMISLPFAFLRFGLPQNYEELFKYIKEQ